MAAGVSNKKTHVDISKSKPNKPSDFSEEYTSKRVKVTLHNNTVLLGTLVEARRYWIKLKTDTGMVYVNKAYVVTIE